MTEFRLIVRGEQGLDRAVPLVRLPFRVGSAAESDLVLKGPGIAPCHFTIEAAAGGQLKLVDQHTEHGTLVNGEFVAQRRVEAGDRIEVGGLRLELGEAVAPAATAVRPAAGSAPSASAAASPPPRPRPAEVVARRAGRDGTFRLVRLVVAAALLGAFVLGAVWTLERVLPESREIDTTGDLLAAGARYVDVGAFAKAREILAPLAANAASGVDRERVETEVRRLEREELRAGHAREVIEALAAPRPLDEQLAKAREAVAAYGDVPEIGDALRTVTLRLEAERPHVAQVEDPVALEGLTDSLILQRNYAGARALWLAVASAELLVDRERAAAAMQVVDSAAVGEAQRLLSRADEKLRSGDVFGASLVLSDSEVAAFRGTTSHDALEARANEIEEALRGRAPTPAASRDGAAAAGGRSDAPRPRHRNSPFETALAASADQLASHDVELALETLRGVDPERLDATERDRLLRHLDRAQRARWLLDFLLHRIEAEPAKVADLTVELRDGTRAGGIRGVRDGELVVAGAQGEAVLAVAALAPASVLALARRFPLSAEDHLNLACYAQATGHDDAVHPALVKAYADAGLKAGIDGVITLQRGLDAVPEWGFLLHEGRFVTYPERERAMQVAALAKACLRLDQGPEKAAAALAEIAEMAAVIPQEVEERLGARRAAALAALNEAPEAAALKKLFEERRELEVRRVHALELIFDEVKYFYPYNPPECPPDKAALYHKVQQEVDERVAEVRALWGKEHEEAAGGVKLSKQLRESLAALEAEAAVLKLAAPRRTFEEPELESWRLLPRDAERVTLRNVAIDGAERARLDEDARVLVHNATVSTTATREELDNVRITNQYRLMMGRRALAVDDSLVRAARGHSEYMSRTGDFGHFEDDPQMRTPRDRMLAAGYVSGGSGENCAMAGGASAAHHGWIHSSGHHRNILEPSHREMGVGGVGMYWTQNYGGGRDYTGNLIEGQ